MPLNASDLEEIVQKMTQIGIALSREQDLVKLLDLIVRETRLFTDSEAGSLYIVEKDSLTFAVAQNEALSMTGSGTARGRFKAQTIPLTKSSLAGYCALTRKPLNIEDAYAIPDDVEYKFNRDFDIKNKYRTRSMLLVPGMVPPDELVCVLCLINRREDTGTPIPYDRTYETLVMSIASQAAAAIQNAHLAQDLKEAYRDTILRLSVATEYRDDDTAIHIRRMSLYSEIIAESIGLSQREVENIKMASPMHDIGKVGISDAILKKPGKLTDEEFAEMRKHTVIGARILEGAESELLQLSQVIALTHHEKWDGSGYPRGLKGEEIPLCGRIVALADVFDALTSPRCYKPAFPIEKAFQIIRESSGKHFDARVVEAFFAAVDQILEVKEHYAAQKAADRQDQVAAKAESPAPPPTVAGAPAAGAPAGPGCSSAPAPSSGGAAAQAAKS